VCFSCAIALLIRSARIPHPLHSSELSRMRPGSSPKSSSPYRPCRSRTRRGRLRSWGTRSIGKERAQPA